MASMSFTTLVRYLKAAYPNDVAPLTARVSKLAEMFDVSSKNISECIRINKIEPMGIGKSGARYCTLEVWEAVWKTRGKEFPKKGGNNRTTEEGNRDLEGLA